MSTELGTAYVTVIPSTRGMTSKISSALDEAAGSGAGNSNGSSFGQSFGNAAKGMIGKISLGTFVGNMLADGMRSATGAVSSSVGSAVSRVDTLNNFPKVMSGIGVSAEESSAAINTMSDRLSNLPTRLDAMASATQSVYTAGRSMGMSLTDATNATLGLNDMLLAGGQGSQVAEAAMVQFTQALAKGKPDMQDWKSIVAAAPAQMDQLAKSMLGPTANQNDLYEALNNGTVSMSDLMDQIVKLDQEGGDGFSSFADQAESATGGIQTSMDNTKNAITRGIANVIQAIGAENIAGAFEDMRTAINDTFASVTDFVSGFMDKLDITGLTQALKDLGDAFDDGFGPAVDAKSVGEDLAKTVNKLKGFLEDIKPVFKILGKVARAFADVLGFLADHIQDVIVALITIKACLKIQSLMEGATSAVTGMGTSAGQSSTQLAQLGIAIAGIGAGIYLTASGMSMLASAAVMLSAAGPGAQVAMALMTVAIGALIVYMVQMAPTLTANAAGFYAFGASLLMAGAAVVLIAAGFMVMALAATMVASAGSGAIAVFAIMVGSVTAVTIVIAALAPVLTAGAVGLLAFGVAALMVGAGVLLATVGVALLATQLPTIATYGASAAAALTLMGLGMVALGAGALVASIALVPLVAALVAATLPMGAFALAIGPVGDSMKKAGSGAKSFGSGIIIINAGANGAASAIARISTAADASGQSLANMSSSMSQSLLSAAMTAAAAAMRISSSLASAARTYTAEFKVHVAKLPHFKMTGEFDAKTGSVPTVSVDYYAAGGIFKRAAVFGEAGPEVATPLTAEGVRPWAEAIDEQRGHADADMIIAWLERNLGRTIYDNAPTMTLRELRRTV
ncbi:MAG: tape measure protein [Coriobacteriales bacterium]|nr:tape measure protein [Coriobacteriaceae bacterium]MDY2723903.1 tape measure protein [Coriobacteriales bacterium]